MDDFDLDDSFGDRDDQEIHRTAGSGSVWNRERDRAATKGEARSNRKDEDDDDNDNDNEDDDEDDDNDEEENGDDDDDEDGDEEDEFDSKENGKRTKFRDDGGKSSASSALPHSTSSTALPSSLSSSNLPTTSASTSSASSSSALPPDLSGWLYKSGEYNSSFRRRYFLLRYQTLKYYKSAADINKKINR